MTCLLFSYMSGLVPDPRNKIRHVFTWSKKKSRQKIFLGGLKSPLVAPGSDLNRLEIGILLGTSDGAAYGGSINAAWTLYGYRGYALQVFSVLVCY